MSSPLYLPCFVRTCSLKEKWKAPPTSRKGHVCVVAPILLSTISLQGGREGAQQVARNLRVRPSSSSHPRTRAPGASNEAMTCVRCVRTKEFQASYQLFKWRDALWRVDLKTVFSSSSSSSTSSSSSCRCCCSCSHCCCCCCSSSSSSSSFLLLFFFFFLLFFLLFFFFFFFFFFIY